MQRQMVVSRCVGLGVVLLVRTIYYLAVSWMVPNTAAPLGASQAMLFQPL